MNRFNMACTEILEILKYLPEEDYKKIPKDEIDFFNQNNDKNYNFKFNEALAFEEQSILPETQSIIVKLYRDHFCTNEQKITLDRILQINNEIELNNLSNVFSTVRSQPKDLFSPTVPQENTLQIHKEKWYKKILNLFYRIYRKKN